MPVIRERHFDYHRILLMSSPSIPLPFTGGLPNRTSESTTQPTDTASSDVSSVMKGVAALHRQLSGGDESVPMPFAPSQPYRHSAEQCAK
jgi:hypothetical protein